MFENWFISRALKKAAVVVAQAATAYALAHNNVISAWGVSLSVNPDVLTAALLAGSEVARNFLKQKFPNVFGWL